MTPVRTTGEPRTIVRLADFYPFFRMRDTERK
jgi:hypothetical protein